MTEITPGFMSRLYEEEKYLATNVEWERIAGHRFSAEAGVRTEDGEHQLKFKAEYWTKAYSFSLLYRNTLVRLWDNNDHHQDIANGHKHPYSEEGEYGEPYPVNDVSTSDVDQALIDFLDECSIRHDEATIYQLPGLDNHD